MNPINQLISAAVPPSVSDATSVDTSKSDSAIIDALGHAKELEHEVLLLIGSVGSGKSTFVDRLREVAIPAEVKERTLWVRIDMNTAPVNPDTIYDWVLAQIISGLRACDTADFDALEVMRKLYAPELRAFDKGEASLFEEQSTEYKSLLAQELSALRRDKLKTAKALGRYLGAERGRALIIAFDNCDKGKRDEQLLMFQVSQWLKSEFRCLVFLPIRDVTYDHHRSEPPLDTALKTLVFRIETPLFTSVLAKRIDLAFQGMLAKDKKSNKLHYTLDNGWKVEYPITDQGMYLMSLLISLYEHDKFIRRTMVGLAGRDVRRALEVFLEFCTSGHISEAEILKIRQAKGSLALPFHIVSRVLLRLNRRYYDGDQSYLCNVFQCDPKDTRPDHFVRLAALRWLHQRVREKGPSGVVGYHKLSALQADMVLLGHAVDQVRREMCYLIEKGCVVTEHQQVDIVSDDDLICLSPSGWVHMRFTSNIDYLSACAEDTWFGDSEAAERVAGRISQSARLHYRQSTSIDNAAEIASYLQQVANEPFRDANIIVESDLNDLHSVEDIVQITRDQLEAIGHGSIWADAETRFPAGTRIKGRVDGVSDVGVFVEIAPGLVGLVHSSKCPADFRAKYKEGDELEIKVWRIDSKRYRASFDIAQGDST